jgi:hypothetical protein
MTLTATTKLTVLVQMMAEAILHFKLWFCFDILRSYLMHIQLHSLQLTLRHFCQIFLL